MHDYGVFDVRIKIFVIMAFGVMLCCAVLRGIYMVVRSAQRIILKHHIGVEGGELEIQKPNPRAWTYCGWSGGYGVKHETGVLLIGGFCLCWFMRLGRLP